MIVADIVLSLMDEHNTHFLCLSSSPIFEQKSLQTEPPSAGQLSLFVSSCILPNDKPLSIVSCGGQINNKLACEDEPVTCS